MAIGCTSRMCYVAPSMERIHAILSLAVFRNWCGGEGVIEDLFADNARRSLNMGVTRGAGQGLRPTAGVVPGPRSKQYLIVALRTPVW